MTRSVYAQDSIVNVTSVSLYWGHI